jgi:hypothetical protein
MRAAGVLVALALALGVTVGCTSDAKNPGIATAATGGAAPGASPSRDIVGEKRRWAQCMRDQGIDIPDPGPDGKIIGFDWNQGGKGSAGANAYSRAEEACRAYETFNQQVERRPLTSKELALWRDWAACMRDHGADQPDPDLYGFPAEEGRRDPAEGAIRDAADQACFDKFMAARMAGVES